MRAIRLLALCPALLLADVACTARGNMDGELRMAEDTPAQFVTEDGVAAEQECRNPMVDPRDHTRLRLIRSSPLGNIYRGDYEVPRGRYGVGQNELLRLDCETGQVIGIVRS
jgi:hypothetical protein